MYRFNTKIRLTMLCLSDFELYSRWVPLKIYTCRTVSLVIKSGNFWLGMLSFKEISESLKPDKQSTL